LKIGAKNPGVPALRYTVNGMGHIEHTIKQARRASPYSKYTSQNPLLFIEFIR
jgi:hypothetical protein